jgi:hypothetical protein
MSHKTVSISLNGNNVVYESEYGQKVAVIGERFKLINSEKSVRASSVRLTRYIDGDFGAVQTEDDGSMRPIPWKAFFRRYVPYTKLYTDSAKVKNGVEGAERVLSRKGKKSGSEFSPLTNTSALTKLLEDQTKSLKGIERALWALVKAWSPKQEDVGSVHQGHLFTWDELNLTQPIPHDRCKSHER